MSLNDESMLRDQAIAWHLRMKNATEQDWNEFAEWLSTDARCNQLYDQVVDADLSLDGLQNVAKPVVANDVEPDISYGNSGRLAWLGGGIAAAVVAVVGFQSMNQSSLYDVSTGAGETRTVAMADGSSLALNGGTIVTLDHDNPRYVLLQSGEAHFTVKHDAANPFTVNVGEDRIVDIGTAFNVVRENGVLTVEVDEGKVQYVGSAQKLFVGAGGTLRVAADGKATAGRKATEAIGAWQRGALIYDQAIIADVARDLSRASGVAVTAAPGVASQRFSGVIQTKGDKAALRSRVEAMLNVRISDTDGKWTLSPASE